MSLAATRLNRGRLYAHVRKNIYGLAAVCIIAAGAGIRVALIALGWPYTNSDEGTYGMMAIDIAFHGAQPIFMYGQHYMGALQAYIAALFFHLFGISLFALRIGLVLLYSCFLAAVYWLTRLLYSRGMALVTVLVLILGSSYVFYRQIQAAGGWTETLFFGAFFYFLASWLAMSANQDMTLRLHILRLVAYSGWGAFVGLSLWSNVVVAPYILTSGVVLLLFCWRDMRSLAPIALIGGLLIGGLPLIIYNIHASASTNSWATLFTIFTGGAANQSRLYYIEHGILGVLLIGLPAITGNSFTCDVNQTLFFQGSGPSAVRCTMGDSLWSLVWIALWVSSVYLSIKAIRRVAGKTGEDTREQRQLLVRHAARLGLLVAAMISLALFAFSSSSTYTPLLSSRYILFIWIATSALLYPLWLGATSLAKPSTLMTRFIAIDSKRMVLLLVVLLLLWGTAKTFLLVPSNQATLTQLDGLILSLERIGAVHIYSDYWTCDRIMFRSADRIICDTVDKNLNQGFVRYAPDSAIVQSDTRASYVFLPALPQTAVIAKRASQPGQHYRRYVFDGYVVYQPA